MIEEVRAILRFLESDIFIAFGTITILFLIGRLIPKIKDSISKIDEMACYLIVFSGMVYMVLQLVLVFYWHFFSEEYQLISRATGPYAWSFWVTLFSWLLITQPFRFKLVRKNVLIRLISIPFFLITLEQYIILITSIHRDYLPLKWSDIDLGGILNAVPYWPLHLLLKLSLFIGYAFIFNWIIKKWRIYKATKVVS